MGIKGDSAYEDVFQISNTFASTWSPYDTMPKEEPRNDLSDVTMRVGGGYRYMGSPRPASRASSARRAREAAMSSRWSQVRLQKARVWPRCRTPMYGRREAAI